MLHSSPPRLRGSARTSLLRVLAASREQSTAPPAIFPTISRLLALTEEGHLVHRLPVGMLGRHVRHIGVIARHPDHRIADLAQAAEPIHWAQLIRPPPSRAGFR